jgi:menaquinone-dependent protoporphyrinogen oxidase
MALGRTASRLDDRPSTAPRKDGTTMRVLVTAASKHGATSEIAEAIAGALREAGLTVDVRPPAEVQSVVGYDAVVLGSAVYGGRWLDAAKRLAEQHRRELEVIPVWVFSSGPIGDPPKPDEAPPDGVAVRETIGAQEHKILGGKVDRGQLSFVERTIVSAVKAPDGDFRDWDEIRAWASGIARAVKNRAVTAA